MMRGILIDATLAAALLAAVALAHGHEQTERYIPIGQSPGVSGKSTWIGVIEEADPKARRLSLTVGGRRLSVALDARTRIWLDRSRLKQTALVGGYGDLQPGRRVEVKYRDAGRNGVAQWIKVEIGEPPGLKSG